MYKIKYLVCLFTCLFLSCNFLPAQSEKPSVLVTVSPDKFFVQKIAGESVNIILMVPPAASAHTYEPSPKQMIAASKAAIWFRIGEPFEERAIQALKSHNATMKIIDLRQGLDLIGACPHSCCHNHPNAQDLHYWLSPRMAEIQANTIAQALSIAFPDKAEMYQKNLNQFIEELNNLNKEIEGILAKAKNRNILVSHPAYAYFCRDYNLKQYSIECEGKDPTPQQLYKILDLAHRLNIKTIFTQSQYSSKGARLIAAEIGAQLVELDPYSENYYESMRHIARAFAEG